MVATGGALVGVAGRTPWTDVAHAQWFDEEQVLVVDPVPGAGAPLRLRLAEPGRVPETVHERVMASIVLSRRVALPGGEEPGWWPAVATAPTWPGRWCRTPAPTSGRPRCRQRRRRAHGPAQRAGLTVPVPTRCYAAFCFGDAGLVGFRRRAAEAGRRSSRSTAASICPWVAGCPKSASAPSRSRAVAMVVPSS